jgi:hypothetical protein
VWFAFVAYPKAGHQRRRVFIRGEEVPSGSRRGRRVAVGGGASVGASDAGK